jgi:tRNA(fMet)-specific endonuclease VapC
MIVLDTNTLSLLLAGQPRVVERRRREEEEVVITIVSRIETLQGRFATLMKAADAGQLLVAQQRLDQAERDLAAFPTLRLDEAPVAVFERLHASRTLRKIGRADLLIAAITLANRGTLVTRNLRDIRRVPGLPLDNWDD